MLATAVTSFLYSFECLAAFGELKLFSSRNACIALMMAAREASKRYGNQMAGNGLKKAAEVIEGTQFAPLFAKAAERGPQAVIALHQALRSNPEYQKLTGGE